MPQASCVGAQCRVKTDAGGIADSTAAGFWTAVDISKTDQGWESVSLTTTADTTEQTIINITEPGVLTHVLAPGLSGAGVVTVRVTIDGTVITFTSPTLAADERFCVGHFLGTTGSSASTTSSTGAGLGSSRDPGYSINFALLMTASPQALVESRIGMIYKTSLVVTVQGSVNLAASDEGKASVSHSLTIPFGL